ncbi:DNA repair protein RecN [Entomospira entomophila]|uniref:DNA repair protein RecN n=1 Tax=Entomospira entomophila TaxID=2719988 RepID=A0A968G8H6_9SPIO|nr:DNA repair protein RecN [Entomospira entomophilus]NIZ40503.1 DNA repair protein RecN [Entomospira entomophilus]WDI36062.1 DNA repair protein RecN [Entomospira entomophilus]
MLQELRVKNYALLDNVKVVFRDGFTVLTGETGAGKSLIVGALGLLLGEKSSVSSIRHGTEELEVVGIIQVRSSSVMMRSLLTEYDILLDDDILELRRVVRLKGTSSIYANGVRITREQLQQLARYIFDLHGQHEHQSLYNKENQRIILDKVAQITDDVRHFSQQFMLLKQERETLVSLQREAQSLRDEENFLQQAQEEIEALQPSEVDKEELLLRVKQLEDRERTQDVLQHFLDSIRRNSGILMQLKELRSSLQILTDGESQNLLERFDGSILEIDDISESFLDLKERIIGTSEEIDQAHRRLMEYQRLEKKYGSGTLIGLMRFYRDIEDKIASIENGEEQQVLCQKRIETLELTLRQDAKSISQARHTTAGVIEAKISKMLADLSLNRALFKIRIEPRTNTSGSRTIGASGVDDVEFLFSANAGEPLKPLKEIASGGEISRILLTLKSVLAEQEEVQCLIFDEIDTGIGGEVAIQVAKHIQELSRHKQVICITHLASIAARAKSQLKLEKQVVDNHTKTLVQEIVGQQRIEEIARMLSGSTDISAIEHAKSLLELGEDHGKKEYHES